MPIHKVSSTGNLFSMSKISSSVDFSPVRRVPSTGDLSERILKKAPLVTSTATILSTASSIISSSDALVAPHPEAATVVSAVASLLGCTAVLLAATIERHGHSGESEHESELPVISWHDGDSDVGVNLPIRKPGITSKACHEVGIVFINGIPLEEYMEQSDIMRIDLKI